MNTKKIACIATFIFAALTSANFASAVDWTPLVRIPGLPAAGAVNLSMYMVGLYNFLLSIVGIVAVMMLIIGGMRYITAAGNSAAIGDAKDIITNAIVGLLLALLSWVFIATINPDVLYIKQPGSSFTDSPVSGPCYKEFDPVAFTCVCIDSFSPVGPFADATACDDECKATNHCGLPAPTPCIAQGSPNKISSLDFDKEPYNGRCKCVDEVFIFPGAFLDCQTACANPASYHCLVADLKVGIDPNIPLMLLDEIARYAVYDSPKEDPIEIADGAVFVVNGETSISGNPVVWWNFDADIDILGVFEMPIPGAANPYLFFARSYAAVVANPLCTTSLTPTAVICPIRFQVVDNAANVREDVVYVKFLAP